MDTKEAKEILRRIDIKFFLSGTIEQSNYIVNKANETNTAIKVVLSELDNKDKIINLMAENIADSSNVYENLVNTEFQHTKEEVIDHFTNKYEEGKG